MVGFGMPVLFGHQKFIYELTRQIRRLFQGGKHSLQRGAIAGTDAGCELLMQARHLSGTRSMAVSAQAGNRRLDRAPIRGIVHPPDERVRLQAVDQLGHVGANAAQPRCQVAERQRFIRTDERAQQRKLRRGEANSGEPCLESVLQRVRRMEQRKNCVIRLLNTDRCDVRVVHACIIQCQHYLVKRAPSPTPRSPTWPGCAAGRHRGPVWWRCNRRATAAG
jgi:hypothetical protein